MGALRQSYENCCVECSAGVVVNAVWRYGVKMEEKNVGSAAWQTLRAPDGANNYNDGENARSG